MRQRRSVVVGERDPHLVLDRVSVVGIDCRSSGTRTRACRRCGRCSSRRGWRRRAASRSCRGSCDPARGPSISCCSVPLTPATASESMNGVVGLHLLEQRHDLGRRSCGRSGRVPSRRRSCGWRPKLWPRSPEPRRRRRRRSCRRAPNRAPRSLSSISAKKLSDGALVSWISVAIDGESDRRERLRAGPASTPVRIGVPRGNLDARAPAARRRTPSPRRAAGLRLQRDLRCRW